MPRESGRAGGCGSYSRSRPPQAVSLLPRRPQSPFCRATRPAPCRHVAKEGFHESVPPPDTGWRHLRHGAGDDRARRRVQRARHGRDVVSRAAVRGHEGQRARHLRRPDRAVPQLVDVRPGGAGGPAPGSDERPAGQPLQPGQPGLPALAGPGAVQRALRADLWRAGRGGRLPARGRPAGHDVQLAVPGPRDRIEPAGVQRVPHHAEHVPGLARGHVLLQLDGRAAAEVARLRRGRRGRAQQHGARAPDGHPHQQRHAPGRQVRRGVAELPDDLSHQCAALRFLYRRRPAAVWLRRRAGLQRPDAVADELDLRRPPHGPEGQGRGRDRGGVRALGLPGVRHRHLGAPVLRSALHPAAEERPRGRRPAEPDLPGR